MLLILAIQLMVATSSDVQKTSHYDAHPWQSGFKVEYVHAKAMCRKMGKRLCNIKDLEILYPQNRSACLSAWAYNHETKRVMAQIVSTEKRFCFDDHRILGVYPRDAMIAYVEHSFWCFVDPKDRKENYECSGSGQDYQGFEAKTRKGKLCQNWYTEYPNVNPFLGTKNSLLKNYCRNPDNKARPWCFFADSVGWDYCDIQCSPYGLFDKCSVEVFQHDNYGGRHCSFSLDGASKEISVDFSYKRDDCNDLKWKKIRSLRLQGMFCNIFLYKGKFKRHSNPNKFVASYSGYINRSKIGGSGSAKSFYLFDLSAEVLLGYKNIEKNFLIAKDYTARSVFSKIHVCSIREVETAHNFVSREDGITFANVFIQDNLYPYFFEESEKGSTKILKQTWCCLNEYPVLSKEKIEKKSKENYCKYQKRDENAFFRGETYNFSYTKRLCSYYDLLHHFSYNDEKFEVGWLDISDLEFDKRFPDVDKNLLQAWCCDTDCLNLYFPCVMDSQCCFGICSENRCDVKREKKEQDPDPDEEKSYLWLKWAFFVVLFYLLGWILRCCFPINTSRRVNVD